MTKNTETAILAGGCFWCLEAVFEALEGISEVTSGYIGGHRPDPTYDEICRGDTGHAEAVRLTFDPNAISFREILEVFFSIHDPTTLNRQGNDVGTQYRSAVFCQSSEQKRVTDQIIAELTAARTFASPIVTEVTTATAFYPAEDYHQHYFAQNAGQPYCQLVVGPKLAKFRKKYANRLKG